MSYAETLKPATWDAGVGGKQNTLQVLDEGLGA